MKPKIALLGAMGEETNLLQKEIHLESKQTIAGREFFLGTLHKVPVVVSFSKWGKVAAAISTTLAIQVFQVPDILFLGVAGSYDDRVKRGDVVLAIECLQHDMDVSALPEYEKWMVPLLKMKTFKTNKPNNLILQQVIRDCLTAPRTLHLGLIGTGDSFLADIDKKNSLKRELPEMLAVDMESAAVAQVCHEFGCAYNVVRLISDGADDEAVHDFHDFIQNQAAPAVKDIACAYVRTRF